MDVSGWSLSELRKESISAIWQAIKLQPLLRWTLRKGSLGCENRKLALDSWSAYPSNDFSESRFVHLPVHQFSSVAQSCPTICNPMDCNTPGFHVHHQLPEIAQTHVHQVGDPSSHLILCHPLHLLPSILPSIRVLFNESALHIRWPKYWSFSISPSNEYSGLISFRMDWLDLLEVQGTLKDLLQHHSSKASILQRSAFFIVQLSHPYRTTGKNIVLTRWTFVGKVMSLLFNMLSRLVITFLPKSKRLLISWLHIPSAVILEPKKINAVTVSTISPSICHKVMGPDAMIFVFWMLSFKPTFPLSHFHQEAL